AWRFAAPAVPVEGRLERRGVRGPAPGLAVVFERRAGDGGGGGSATGADPASGAPAGGGDPASAVMMAVSDADGRFALALPPGEYTVRVDDPAVEPYTAPVSVRGVAVALAPIALTPSALYDDVVVVRARRDEGSTRLDAAELRSTAGSLGDPLRVVQSLPSVGTYLSLIPFPIVRGSSPGETGITLDGTRLPLMFHSAIGLSVVPPQLVEAIELHPGIAPLRFGRYTGGTIEATTRDPVEAGWLGEVSVDLAQASALLSVPIGEHGRVTAMGRTSYAGWLLEALEQPFVLAFDDYHLRYTWRHGRRRVQASVFGATDEFGDRDRPHTSMAFHRLALRWIEPVGQGALEAALDLGYDLLSVPSEGDYVAFRSTSGDDLTERMVAARLIWDAPIEDWGALELGAEGIGQRAVFTDEVGGSETLSSFGAWGSLRCTLGPLTLTPGVRLDVYPSIEAWSLDPRLDLRWALGEATALVGRVGVMSGPQRGDWPVPGSAVTAGDALQHARQLSVGVEQGLPAGFELTWTFFASVVSGLGGSGLDPGLPAFPPELEGAGVLLPLSDRRARGAELLLRRRVGRVTGWLAYTAQRVDRLNGYDAWVPSALEQQHLVNLVLDVRLPDGWRVGTRLHYASGRPVSAGAHARLDDYAQLDVRVEKQWIADAFELWAYLDVVNATRSAEDARQTTLLTEPDDEGRPVIDLFLPMLGVRAQF
ncbi:MAG: TonB-dependent receptor, partial [Myxococcales bacterium]|nr:TonB-dependent receptor [Myxococcales bacterium]